MIKTRYFKENGKGWYESTLIEACKGITVEEYPIETIESMPRWKLSNVYDFSVHYNRILNTDLTIPIIIRSYDDCLLDGWHRLIKALANDYEVLPAYIINKMPKHDFLI